MPRKKNNAPAQTAADAFDPDAHIDTETAETSQDSCSTCLHSQEWPEGISWEAPGAWMWQCLACDCAEFFSVTDAQCSQCGNGAPELPETCKGCINYPFARFLPGEIYKENWTSAADAADPGASIIPNDHHWLDREQITVTQELTQAEKAEYADEMAAAQGEKDRLELEIDGIKKRYKRLIDDEDAKISKAAKIVREGKEAREILCDKLADYNACEIVWTEAYPPHVEVQRRKMTAEERQLPLEKRGKPEVETEPENADEIRDCETCRYGTDEGCSAVFPCEGDAFSAWEAIPPAVAEEAGADAVQ
jgi:hypothetical protein